MLQIKNVTTHEYHMQPLSLLQCRWWCSSQGMASTVLGDLECCPCRKQLHKPHMCPQPAADQMGRNLGEVIYAIHWKLTFQTDVFHWMRGSLTIIGWLICTVWGHYKVWLYKSAIQGSDFFIPIKCPYLRSNTLSLWQINN